jgi:CBS domain containing-hemolysin-like protein
MELNILKNNLNLNYYKNLKKNCKKFNINEYFLTDIIDNLENTLSKNESSVEESEIKSDNNNVIYSEDYVYKKPWTKLNSVHKIIKIKEFVSKLLIEDKNDKIELINRLKFLVKNKIITKKDKVNYDKLKGRIISIPDLIYKNKKYYI